MGETQATIGRMGGMLVHWLGACRALRLGWSGAGARKVVIPPGGGHWTAVRGPSDDAWWVSSLGGQHFKLGDLEFRDLQGRVADAGGEMTVREVRVEFGERVETWCRTVGHRLDGESRAQPGLARRTAAWSDFYYYRAGNPVGHERLDAQQRYA